MSMCIEIDTYHVCAYQSTGEGVGAQSWYSPRGGSGQAPQTNHVTSNKIQTFKRAP